MAERASKESLANASHDGQQKYRSALNIIETDILRAKQQQSKAGGEAGQAWQRIEKMGVNKKGAQIASGILGMEEQLRDDVVRTVLNILALRQGLPQRDLVDIAERLGAEGGDGRDQDGDDEDGDEADEGKEDEGNAPGQAPVKEDADPDDAPKLTEEWAEGAEKVKPAQKVDGDKPKPATPSDARARAKAHLTGVPSGPASSSAAGAATH